MRKLGEPDNQENMPHMLSEVEKNACQLDVQQLELPGYVPTRMMPERLLDVQNLFNGFTQILGIEGLTEEMGHFILQMSNDPMGSACLGR